MNDVAISRVEREVAVAWDASATSNALNVKGKSAALILDLPAAFTGTTLTYERKLADGTWSPVYSQGAAVSDIVPATTKSSNVLSADLLFGLGEFRIVSDQVETCEGTLHVAS